MPKNTSNSVIQDDEGNYKRWQLPDMKRGHGALNAIGYNTVGVLPTAQQLEELQKAAYAEGLELGKKEGLNQAKAQIQDQVRRLEAVLKVLGRPLAEADDELVTEVSELALTIAKQIIRREVKTDPGQVMAAVRRAMEVLPMNSRNLRVFLNPDDLEFVKETLTIQEDGVSGWQLVEDPSIGRGGCRVETETSTVDSTIEKQVAAIATELLGGDRQDDPAR